MGDAEDQEVDPGLAEFPVRAVQGRPPRTVAYRDQAGGRVLWGGWVPTRVWVRRGGSGGYPVAVPGKPRPSWPVSNASATDTGQPTQPPKPKREERLLAELRALYPKALASGPEAVMPLALYIHHKIKPPEGYTRAHLSAALKLYTATPEYLAALAAGRHRVALLTIFNQVFGRVTIHAV